MTTDDPNVVIKKIYHRNRAQQRTCSLRAAEQAKMQEWARSLCTKAGFQLLFVPRAWDAEKHSYKMQRIDVSQPLDISEVKDHKVLAELQQFYVLAKHASVFPMDYELYVQPDGKVGMVDFDKFSSWSDGTIQFPWGLEMKDSVVKDMYPYLFV